MRSLIAALRTLVLPFGTTSGARIVLDGVAGVISIYDASNNLLVTMDGNGFITYDTAGLPRLKLGVPTLFSMLEFLTGDALEIASGNIRALVQGTAPNKRVLLSLDAPDLGRSGFLWTLINRQATADSPILKADTSTYTGSAQPYIDLCGAAGASQKTRVAADEFWIGTTGGDSGQVPTLNYRVPWGVLAPKLESTSNSSAISSEQTVLGDTATVNVKAGRRYRVTYYARTLNISAALDTVEVRVKRIVSGIPVIIGDAVYQAGVAGENFGGIIVPAIYEPATDAAATFRATAERTSGTGTGHVLGATATSPMYLLVEDIGNVA